VKLKAAATRAEISLAETLERETVDMVKTLREKKTELVTLELYVTLNECQAEFLKNVSGGNRTPPTAAINSNRYETVQPGASRSLTVESRTCLSGHCSLPYYTISALLVKYLEEKRKKIFVFVWHEVCLAD
jgi:hypothetical protein